MLEPVRGSAAAVAKPAVADGIWKKSASAIFAAFCGEAALNDLGEYDMVSAIDTEGIAVVGVVNAVTRRRPRSRPRQRPLSGVAAAAENGVLMR